MAEDKKSFLLYADLIHTVKKMPDEKAGQLFKVILSYVNDENPFVEDMLIDLVFEPIKRQMKRDLKKYEEKKRIWSEAGKKGAEAKRNAKELSEGITEVSHPKPPLPIVNDGSTKSTVTATATATVNDTVTVKASSSSFDVFEVMRCRLLPSQFSDTYIREEAVKFVKKYKSADIKNMAALISTWVSNMEPDIKPKRFIN